MRFIFIVLFILGVAGTVYFTAFTWYFTSEYIFSEIETMKNELAIGAGFAVLYGFSSWLMLLVINQYWMPHRLISVTVWCLLPILIFPSLLVLLV